MLVVFGLVLCPLLLALLLVRASGPWSHLQGDLQLLMEGAKGIQLVGTAPEETRSGLGLWGPGKQGVPPAPAPPRAWSGPTPVEFIHT